MSSFRVSTFFHHGQLFVRAVAGGHLDHHTLARHEEGGDEDEKDVIEEQGGQQDCADPQARKAQHFQHVDAEHNP